MALRTYSTVTVNRAILRRGVSIKAKIGKGESDDAFIDLHICDRLPLVHGHEPSVLSSTTAVGFIVLVKDGRSNIWS